MSSPRVKQQFYQFRYSRSVVDAFLENYGRVHIFIARKLSLEPSALRDHLIVMFMKRNARFQVWRETLKKVHNYNMYDTIAPMTRSETISYLRALSTLVEDDFIDRGFSGN